MYCINDRDLEYILNKYHDTGKEFDPFHRFIRNDAIFDESAGMDGEQIIKNILRLTRKPESAAPVRKALVLPMSLRIPDSLRLPRPFPGNQHGHGPEQNHNHKMAQRGV